MPRRKGSGLGTARVRLRVDRAKNKEIEALRAELLKRHQAVVKAARKAVVAATMGLASPEFNTKEQSDGEAALHNIEAWLMDALVALDAPLGGGRVMLKEDLQRYQRSKELREKARRYHATAEAFRRDAVERDNLAAGFEAEAVALAACDAPKKEGD